MNIGHYFDFVHTSYEFQSEKPESAMFDAAIAKVPGAAPSTAYHIGDSISKDVGGAAAAGWMGIRYKQWFDEELPDWSSIESKEEADQGQEKRQALMLWGRKDTSSGLDWVEVWGIDDILTLFGFPEDDSKPIRATYIRGFLDD